MSDPRHVPKPDCRAIDVAQLGRLLDQHGAALALFAQQWTQASDDCVQDAFVELAGQTPAPDEPIAWLYRVVRNRALNAARSERRRKHRESEVAARMSQLSSPLDLDERAALAELLNSLAIEAREVVVLRIWGQLGWQEIAEVIGRSRSSAQREYLAALELLRANWSCSDSRGKNSACSDTASTQNPNTKC
ncbi:MAG: sigma-70 family RNA polymerase sigma factor [Planctomycetales bacterium]|nr:sigma-70 family RNA polymerase sigma factor [Planctomycetales bacterium]